MLTREYIGFGYGFGSWLILNYSTFGLGFLFWFSSRFGFGTGFSFGFSNFGSGSSQICVTRFPGHGSVTSFIPAPKGFHELEWVTGWQRVRNVNGFGFIPVSMVTVTELFLSRCRIFQYQRCCDTIFLRRNSSNEKWGVSSGLEEILYSHFSPSL